MPENFLIGIDLGGTFIKAGALDSAAILARRWSIETQAAGGFDHVFARLVELIRDIAQQTEATGNRVSAVGIGVPGPMSHKRGFIYGAPNLPGWIDIPLRDLLERALSLPVTLENDANAAAYGEFVAGAGCGCNELVLLTLGTGIGGGVVAGGRMHRGHFDNAGEIGHVIAVPDGRPCPCGQCGCLERYASANALAERLIEAIQTGERAMLAERVHKGDQITSQDVLATAQAGCATAIRIWDEACRHLAVACVNLQHLLNPQRILFAGGLINAGPPLLTGIQRHFERLNWRVAKDQPELAFATLGGDAGIIGAAALAREARQK